MDEISFIEAANELDRRLRTGRLYLYRPYPKQFEFHALGAKARERALFAGNQLGKTYSAGYEVAMHATGIYPDWWPGYRYDRPIPIWTGSESNEKSKEIIQAALYGCESTDMSHPDFGTGTIPKDAIKKISKRQSGVSDVAGSSEILHVSGRISTITHKVYEQGWQKFTGKTLPFVWLDEEPDKEKIYSESLTRTAAVKDGRLIITFTPLNGMTEVVQQYQAPSDGEPKPYVNMTINDVMGGVWPEGTPWAGEEWTGHHTKESAKEMIAAWPKHERRTRALGVPMAGEGMVFPIDEDEIKCNPVPYQNHWAKINGMDFGIGHPFGFAQLWHDRDTDTIYLAFVHKKADEMPPAHVSLIKKQGDWVTTAWPHDGMNRGKDGQLTIKLYQNEGLLVLPRSARYQEDTGGRQPLEPIIMELYQRMIDGRFKVFNTCGQFFDELRNYHRKDGKLSDINDDIIKAVFYALMDLRYAQPNYIKVSRSRPVRRAARQWG